MELGAVEFSPKSFCDKLFSMWNEKFSQFHPHESNH